MPRLTIVRVLAALVLFMLIASALVWLSRKPIADSAIRSALQARGVRASYTVKNIGLRWERIEHLRVGDPRAPDLTADWAELRVSTGLSGVSVTAIRAGGVRLYGRIVDNRLRLGDIDKLLTGNTTKTSVTLPDIDINLTDARARIDSPWGGIGMKIDGHGNVRNGFAGKVAATMPLYHGPQCDVRGGTAYVDVIIRNQLPRVRGPLRAIAARCAGAGFAKPAAAIDVTLNDGLTHWRGTMRVEAQGVQYRTVTLAALTGRASFEGIAAQAQGSADFSAQAGRVGMTRLLGIGVKGNFANAQGLHGDGQITVQRLIPDIAASNHILDVMRAGNGSPVGPLLDQMATVLRRTVAGVAVTAAGSFSASGGTVSRLTASDANGARLTVEGGKGLSFGAAGFVADTSVSLSGGGFPAVQSHFQHRPDGTSVGLATVGSFAAGRARLDLSPFRFAATPAGAMRIETTAQIDGPVADGFVEGLRIPVFVTIRANSDMFFDTDCAPVTIKKLMLSGLVLDPASLRLCPTGGRGIFQRVNGQIGGGVTVDQPHLKGRMGAMPIALAASRVHYDLTGNALMIDSFATRLGTGDRVSRLEIGLLNGRLSHGAIVGRFNGASGAIANVPVLIDKAAGDWTFRNGGLALRGGVSVSDGVMPLRYNPLISRDVTLSVVNGGIRATATLRNPATDAEVTRIVMMHDMPAGTGSAVLDVASLRFDRTLQPEQLTPLTLGVVANVDGTVAGRGTIRWGPAGITSKGSFSTESLDFAAAFGPVRGLKGAIAFDDLLALTTPPGQRVSIASVNPGTLVTDGLIIYHLQSGQRIAIESGTWPFAGGSLLLDPTVLDMGQPSERKLTFRVVALDAAKFIQQLEFENLAATGIFDGILPMTFDDTGGRIDDGHLVVRRGGGTLAYVGEISNTQMNMFARLAFDALKSIRYQNLKIDLHGPLDGEIISQIGFDGVNESPLSPPKSYLARKFIGLPFVFNIKVTAPFRSLLNSARTLQDPGALIGRTLPDIQKRSVQPRESDHKP